MLRRKCARPAPCRSRAVSLGLFGVVLLAAVAPVRPLRAEIPPPKHRIERVRFEQDGPWLVLAVPTEAAWAHWTLANPPRIIVDFSDAISALPEAPGLYEIALDRGPITRFRTSQFSNTPLDRRVRLTLELRQITPYEARKVGSEVRILVEAPDAGGTPAYVDARGFHEGGSGTGPAAAPSRSAARLDEALAQVFGKKDSADTPASDPAEGPGGPSTGGRAAERGLSDPAPMPKRADDRAGSGRAAREEPGDPADAHGAGANPDGQIPAAAERPTEPAAPAGPSPEEAALAEAIDPGTDGRTDDVTRMRGTLERLLGQDNVDPVHETAGGEILTEEQLADRLREEEFPEEDWEDWQDFEEASEIEPPDSLRTRRATLLLEGAIRDWMDGDVAGAERRAERCRRYYGEYPPGAQAGLLLREIHLTSGRSALAAAIRAVPALPDTAFFDSAFFLRLLSTYYGEGRRDLLIERMEDWGHLFPAGGWYPRYHFALGREAYLAREVEAAEDHLARVRPEDPRGDEALVMRARLADESGRELDALSLYRQLARQGTGVYALRGLARTADLEFQRGRIEEATRAYEELLAADPPADEEVWAHYQLGNLHLLAGAVGRARSSYEAVLSLQPGSFWAEFAEERLGALEWEGELARRIDDLRNP